MKNITDEIWKDIVGFEKHYQVSSLGKIKSLVRTIIRSNDKPYPVRERILSPGTDTCGYLRVSLGKNKKFQTFKVHRIVAFAFIPNINNKPEINHIDFNKKNNDYANLEWVTSKENTDHAIKNNRFYYNAGWNRKEFSQEIISKLGTMPDYKLAKIADTNKTTMARIRKNLGIKSYAEETGNDGRFKKRR